MHAYPQLRHISINASDHHDYEAGIETKMLSASDNFSSMTVAKFLTYVEKVPSHTLSLFYTKNIPSIYEEYLALSISYTTTLKTLTIVVRDVQHISERDNTVEICMTDSKDYHAGEKGFELTYNCTGANMPYLSLFKRCGASIGDLTFLLNGDDALENLPTLDSFRMAAGYILEHIFKYCPRLTRLDLLSMKLIQCDPNVQVNRSITDLTLQDCILSNLILPGLSTRFPSLQNLSPLYCGFPNTNPDIAACTYYLVDMPNNAFDTLIIESRLKKLTLAVETTMQTHRYFNVFYSRRTDIFEAVSIEEHVYNSVA